MQRPKSLFGRAQPKPAYGLDAVAGASGDDPQAEGFGHALDDEDLEHKGMGSLSGISIHRGERGAAAPAGAAAGAIRPSQTEPRNISEYWSRLRGRRLWPARSDIDTKLVSIKWKNCLFIVIGERGTPWRFETLTPGVMRGGGGGLTDNDIDFNHLVMEWILEMGRAVQQSGKPLEDNDLFPGHGGEVRYRVVAVPLGDDDTAVTHVLCHIARM